MHILHPPQQPSAQMLQILSSLKLVAVLDRGAAIGAGGERDGGGAIWAAVDGRTAHLLDRCCTGQKDGGPVTAAEVGAIVERWRGSQASNAFYYGWVGIQPMHGIQLLKLRRRSHACAGSTTGRPFRVHGATKSAHLSQPTAVRRLCPFNGLVVACAPFFMCRRARPAPRNPRDQMLRPYPRQILQMVAKMLQPPL